MVRILSILFLLIILFTGCALNRSYNFYVINETYYNIDSIEIGCDKKAKVISVSRSDTSAIVNIPFNYIFAFAEPSVCVTVTNYSDSTGKYVNSYGTVILESDLVRFNTNVIHIEFFEDKTKQKNPFKIKIQYDK